MPAVKSIVVMMGMKFRDMHSRCRGRLVLERCWKGEGCRPGPVTAP